MTTTKTAVIGTKGADAAKQEKGVKEPQQLSKVIQHFAKKAELLKNRAQVVHQMDKLDSLTLEGTPGQIEETETVNSIEIYGTDRTRYTISNTYLIHAVVAELKAQMKFKLEEIDQAILAD